MQRDVRHGLPKNLSRYAGRLAALAGRRLSIVVLVLLCLISSAATWQEQNPITKRSGAAVARQVLQECPERCSVLLVVRDTEGDRAFAEAFERGLAGTRASIVGRVAGQPRDVRLELDRIERTGVPLHAVATHRIASEWGPLRAVDVPVIVPRSYRWPTFLTLQNLLNVVNQNADVAIIALGMTLVILTAGIDLSVGSLLALSGVIAAVAAQEWFGGGSASLSGLLAAGLLGILAAALGGLLTGTMVTKFRVPPFVATLGLMMVARGLALILAVGHQRRLSGGGAEGTPEAVRVAASAFSWLGNGSMLGVPNPIVLMLALYVGAHFLMTQTRFGRYVYAVGGNADAARLTGVPVTTVLIAVYCLCGAAAGLAGIVDASRFEGGRPNAGELYELQVIAAVVVGGASLAGGRGRVSDTLIGAMIIAVIQNGLNIAGVASYEQKVVFGGLILGAVLLDRLQPKISSSRARMTRGSTSTPVQQRIPRPPWFTSMPRPSRVVQPRSAAVSRSLVRGGFGMTSATTVGGPSRSSSSGSSASTSGNRPTEVALTSTSSAPGTR